MNREQVKELFQLLGNAYPHFIPNTKEELSDKVDVWTSVMKSMDYERVMARAKEHIQANKFPPTIAEVSAYAPKKNDTLEKMERWEKEAAEVPQEVKDRFRRKIINLFEEKSND